jgi:hypothetical protein
MGAQQQQGQMPNGQQVEGGDDFPALNGQGKEVSTKPLAFVSCH